MLLRKRVEIVIRSTPERIWDFASDPANWTASNPEEHQGLSFDNRANRPETGVTFHQRETVAGFFADLRGHIQYALRPKVCVWTGVATYRVLGLRVRIPEGGAARLEPVEGGTEMSHAVYMDFPETLRGRIAFWLFKNLLRGEERLYSHAYKELLYFKGRLED